MGFVEHRFPFYVHRQPSSQDGLLGTGNYLQENSHWCSRAAKGDRNKIRSYLVQNLNAENKINQKTRRHEDSSYADVWATGERYSDCLLPYEHIFHLFTEAGRGYINQIFKNLIYSNIFFLRNETTEATDERYFC